MIANKIDSFCNKHLNTTKQKIFFSIIVVFIYLSFFLILLKTNFINNLLSYLGVHTTEQKVVEHITNAYNDGVGGAVKIEESADWTSLSNASVEYTISSIIENTNHERDIILVLDISESSKIIGAKQNIINEAKYYLSDPKNRLALIAFNGESQILTDFTNDFNLIEEQINNLTAGGLTNYYKALKDIDILLTNYEHSNQDVSVIFFSDGFANQDKSNNKTQYEYLKNKYSYLQMNAVQYQVTSSAIPDLDEISDNIYIIYGSNSAENLKEQLYILLNNPRFYEDFKITKYIDNDNFYIEDKSKIEIPYGNAYLSTENGQQKLTIEFGKDTYNTGGDLKFKIDYTLQENNVKKEGFYGINSETEITYKLYEKDAVTVNSNHTPVLKAGYEVSYDANPPEGCNIKSTSSDIAFAYGEVTKSSEVPVCEGYYFKGWDVTEPTETINENAFIMPSHNVQLNGTWTKLSISKSMQGTIYEKTTLYKTMASQAVADNIASQYVTSSSGIDFFEQNSNKNGNGVYKIGTTLNDKYPIYYYRGAVDNNVIFANFCWKIIRTTETGGTKLIYNGIPTNGVCNNTGVDTTIGTSYFNFPAYEFSSTGYMYNNSRSVVDKDMDWYRLAGYYARNYSMAATTYLYSTSVTYSNGKYTLQNPQSITWETNYSNAKGMYTCFSENTTSCSYANYIYNVGSKTAYYVELRNGDTYDAIIQELANTKMVFGADLSYQNGMYTLTDTKTITLNNYLNEYNELSKNYKYSCFSSNNTCAEAYYNLYGSSEIRYFKLTGGETMQDVIDLVFFSEDESTYVNSKDSTIKSAIDTWYESNMINHTKYLEDTIWCNDQSINIKNTFDNGYMMYDTYNRYSKRSSSLMSLSCPNKIDSFTTDKENGNGDLKYPIGLLNVDEGLYAGLGYYGATPNTNYLDVDLDYWTMTPSDFNSNMNSSNYIYSVNDFGFISPSMVSSSLYIRPVISLKNNVEYNDGTGTQTDPYIIDESKEY